MTAQTRSGAVPVAFVSDSRPERNGVGAYYSDLVCQLDRLSGPVRFESKFLCPGRDIPSSLRFPLPGDATQTLHLPGLRAFAEQMRRAAPAVVVVATPGPFGWLGARWARKLGARLIVGFHTDYAGVTDLYRLRLLRVLSRGYFRRVDRMLFRRADHVLVNTKEMIEQARRRGARRVSRIGTLLPPALLETPTRPHQGEIRRVLFAGRLAPEKRLDQLLDAAKFMPTTDFVIAGDGPLRSNIATAAGQMNNLTWVGWLTREQLMTQLDRADALVLPSAFESFGNVALEAMARERIAVVTSTCGIAHWKRLAAHLTIYAVEGDLRDALLELNRKSSEQLIAQARAARQAAEDLNRESLGAWVELLQPQRT